MRPNLPTAFDIAKSKGYTDEQILAGFGGEEARNEVLGVKKKKELTEKQIMAGFGGKAAKEKLISGQTKSLLSSAIASLSVIDAIFKARLDALNQATSQTRLARKEADIERRDATAVKPSETQSPSEVGGKTLIAGLLIGAAIPLFEKIAEMFPGVIAGFKATASVVYEFIKAIGDGLSYLSKALSVLDPIVESDTYKWLKGQVGLGGEEQPPEPQTQTMEPVKTQTMESSISASAHSVSVPAANIPTPTKPPSPTGQTQIKQETTQQPPVSTPVSKPSISGNLTDTQNLIVGALNSRGITDPKSVANILAQIKAESNFKPRSEGLYSAKQLFNMYGPNQNRNKVRFQTLEEAEVLRAQGAEAVFNRIYGGRMGNDANEGYKYRGRGFIQLTGKDNYKRMSGILGIDLVSNPDLANDPEIAAKIAAEYYKSKKIDLTDINAVTKATAPANLQTEMSARAQYASQFEQLALAESSAMAKAKTKTIETIVIAAPATKTAKPSPTTTASLSDSTPDYIKRLVA